MHIELQLLIMTFKNGQLIWLQRSTGSGKTTEHHANMHAIVSIAYNNSTKAVEGLPEKIISIPTTNFPGFDLLYIQSSKTLHKG